MINKYTQKEYGQQWTFSDSHHCHSNIFKYDARTEFMTSDDLISFNKIKDNNGDLFRNWKPSKDSMHNMHAELIKRINKNVKEFDTLWFLGDFSFSDNYNTIFNFRKQINCKDIRIIYGNHDKRDLLMPIDGRTQLFTKAYDSCLIYFTEIGAFDEDEVAYDKEIGDYVKLNYNKINKVYMNHYFNAVFNGSHKNKFYHFYGHSHLSMNKWQKEHCPNIKAKDVFCGGNNYYPYSVNELILELDKIKKVHDIDHHGPMKIIRDSQGNH